ncbi:hypothetical protein EYV94_22905 [Puteibacter caeruleilacunae]|nr:hypothetical protein EYV94_22905 [Puteibacter caeruleilacunae]
MKVLLSLLIVILSTSILSGQETKIITGRIISEDIEPIPKAIIHNMDTIALGSTGVDGYFKIEVPAETKELLLGFIGMEWISVKIREDCQNLEIIMMVDVIYDFISIKRINKKRYKRFKGLAKRHLQAYERGIFKSRTPCISYVFEKY